MLCVVVLETNGSPEAVGQAVNMLRRKGRLITGERLETYTYSLAIKYLSEDLVKMDKIVTHNLLLKEKGNRKAEKHLENTIKVTITL